MINQDTSTLKNTIINVVEQVSPWKRIPTSIDGVYIVKAPSNENNNTSTVFVEINPSVNGQPVKKRGLYLKNINEFNTFKEILSNTKVQDLLKVIMECYSNDYIEKIEI